LDAGERLAGPVIIESSFTTVVVEPGAAVERSAAGNLIIYPSA
jgi:N-methylhydantoinase A